MSKKVFELDFLGKKITVETGELAKQANGSVLVRYEDTVVLTAAVMGRTPITQDFFPLTVLYQEKLYSVGKIPGGFIKREGRPTDQATLTARLIDRPIRPMFDENFRNEVQVINTVLSVDQDCSPEMTALLGSSLALTISNIPFDGPVAGVVVGKIGKEYIINPTPEQQEESTIHLTVAGTKDAICMVEAGAKEVSEKDMLSAAVVKTSTFSFCMTKAAMLSEMTVTSKPISRQTVAVRRAPWKYGLVSGQKSLISFPCSLASLSIIPTMVSAKQ